MADDADVVFLPPAQPPARIERNALIAGLIAAVVLAVLVGWLGFRTAQAQNREHQRDLFVRAARDVAVTLNTADPQHADADAQRIQDVAEGTFADSFAHHKQAYVDRAKRSQARSSATVSDAGLESQSGKRGRVLVAVTAQSAEETPAADAPQLVRMRITVHKVGDGAKISDVEFIS